MKMAYKKILSLLLTLFTLSDVYAIEQIHLLEDFSNTEPPIVRQQLKLGFTEMMMGGTLVMASRHVPSLGSKNTSREYDYDLLSPTTLKVFGKALVFSGTRKFISAANEEYNIFRGSRLQENQRTLLRGIRNGVVDICLAGCIYYSHQHIPNIFMDSYIELAGPPATVVVISYLGMRGITTLATDFPTWTSKLDWSLAASSLKRGVVGTCSRFLSLVKRTPQAQKAD